MNSTVTLKCCLIPTHHFVRYETFFSTEPLVHAGHVHASPPTLIFGLRLTASCRSQVTQPREKEGVSASVCMWEDSVLMVEWPSPPTSSLSTCSEPALPAQISARVQTLRGGARRGAGPAEGSGAEGCGRTTGA